MTFSYVMGFVGGFFFVVEGKFFSLLVDLEVIPTSIWGCHNQSRFGIKRCVSWGSKDQLQGQGGVDGFDAASHGPCGLKWKISGHRGVATLGAQWLYCMVIFQQRVFVVFPEENSDQSGDVMSMCQVSMYPRYQRSRKKAERHALSVDTEAWRPTCVLICHAG